MMKMDSINTIVIIKELIIRLNFTSRKPLTSTRARDDAETIMQDIEVDGKLNLLIVSSSIVQRSNF